ncbi:Uncharacterised protein [uncultured Flavonifractor sp.]|uniref:CD1845 family protein n=1 Tax=Intestinimonas butyriciproducens TaxID=1297617 RepID=UPI0006BFAB58|nr:CD1845 family protein [Intestinimonas butyriciproducens]BDE86864.1 hypothetical protein CE91St42_13220 [Oscillospiraceae bacterium]CUQ62642.1 Uncharacterised protein [Flavonifractor plautii]SCJ59219.1 Uncharacterised protein [uncultured Flavonifractor sp.]
MLVLKILAAPFLLILTLLAAVITFLACIAGALCYVACILLTLLGLASLSFGMIQGGIVGLVLAFLVSPFGFPAIGEWLLLKLYGVKFALQDFITG